VTCDVYIYTYIHIYSPVAVLLRVAVLLCVACNVYAMLRVHTCVCIPLGAAAVARVTPFAQVSAASGCHQLLRQELSCSLRVRANIATICQSVYIYIYIILSTDNQSCVRAVTLLA
jgi:hypothetical protein